MYIVIVCGINPSHNGVNFTTAQDLMFWNDDLLVVFTDGSASVICKFTKLFENFATSRIERLRCPLKQPEHKYFILFISNNSSKIKTEFAVFIFPQVFHGVCPFIINKYGLFSIASYCKARNDITAKMPIQA
jgi:hypothetical protein